MEPKYLGFPIIFLLCYYIASVIFYIQIEDWSLLDSVYFMSSTLSLIGLGDIYPKTDMGKIYVNIFNFWFRNNVNHDKYNHVVTFGKKCEYLIKNKYEYFK